MGTDSETNEGATNEGVTNEDETAEDETNGTASDSPDEDLRDRHADLTPADSVVISYPEDLSDWGRWQVEKDPFEAYLRKTKTERVRQGDVWEEFVGVGCCGSTLDVPLRVERIDGGTTFGPDTEIEWEVREACGIQGGWQVQSQGGPNRV